MSDGLNTNGGIHDAFGDACAPLFSSTACLGEQYDAAHRLFDLLSGIIGYDDNAPAAHQARDTFLPGGKAISLQGAARCLWEFARSSKFLRGVEAALRAAQTRFPCERVRLLEAGCGPFALLALPLATRFGPEEVGFTLLDIHEHSLDAARRIVVALGLEDYIDGYVCADATTWRCPDDARPHAIVSETMQNGLKNEPQVAVTRNLAPQRLPGGFFLPEAVGLDFSLLTWQTEGLEVPRSRSHRIATLFELTPDCADETEMAGTFTLPGTLPANARPAVCTRIRVFGDIDLGENECSLTIPLRINDLPPLKGGETLQFAYASPPKPGVRFSLAPVA